MTRVMTNTKGLAPQNIGIKPAPKDSANGLPCAYVNGKLRYEITGIDAYGQAKLVYGTKMQALRVAALRAFGTPLWQDEDLCACGIAEKPRSKPVEARRAMPSREAIADLHMRKLLDTVELALREPALSHLDETVCEAPARDVTDAISEASREGFAMLAESREDLLLRKDALAKARAAEWDALRATEAFGNALTLWTAFEALCRKHDAQEAHRWAQAHQGSAFA